MIFVIFPVELPPRTRRIHATEVLTAVIFGTTSAYAENTRIGEELFSSLWNYLRVRGEYVWPEAKNTLNKELPPRTRRIQINVFDLDWEPGTTSAYAENTAWCMPQGSLQGNYLRVRGEYCTVSISAHAPRELPPRTRRIP